MNNILEQCSFANVINEQYKLLIAHICHSALAYDNMTIIYIYSDTHTNINIILSKI